MIKGILYAAATILSLIALFYISLLAIIPIAFLVLLFSTHKPRPRPGRVPPHDDN